MSQLAPVRTSAPPRPWRRRGGLLIGALLLAGADLFIKAQAEANLARGEVIETPLLTIKLLYNTGVAFSLGAALPTGVVVAGTGVVIAALLSWLTVSAPKMSRTSFAGGILVAGGGIGNFIDRLDGRGVVDYLHSGWFPTFNLADVFVTVGVAVLVLGTLLPGKDPENRA
ncbi:MULTISPECIES: signal peptidase II [Pseudarthrobacter]|uniref:signal peptidase II n=1 Tax=Pseudarthrobacter TaxID=1742993 RepID=UPI00203C75D7|nr:signal peptidase II [Pseudarthrobacter sp. NCCP-2145]WHP59527.1 signal peptidase II [Arthrobacter sp. KFRI-F3372]GKV71884.1 lipoprotein signal peptidase [Pseudarthrobacter sp. NCCP-2145]